MSEARPQVNWRIKIGFAIFIVSIGWPILIPILSALGIPAAAFSGVMVVAADLMLVAGAAIAGKEGFAFIKQTVLGKLKLFAPAKKVSLTRYRIGLVMFVATLLLGWAAPYFGHYFPGYETHVTTYAIGGDLILLSGLFLLGGDFWDKLRSLFVHNATARFPQHNCMD